MSQEPKPEIWRPIAGYEGRYEVSSMGRVRSFLRRGQRRTATAPLDDYARARLAVEGQTAPTRTIRILAAKQKENGYMEVGLCRPGERMRMAYIHRLVAEAFHGPAPHPKAQAAHLNGVKTDNRWSNLAWVTPKANSLHKRLNGDGDNGNLKPLKRRAIAALQAQGFDRAEIAAVLSLRVTSKALATEG